MGREVASVEGLTRRCRGHGAEDCKVRCKPETAGSLHTRWLRFVASERTN
jgi:hypothetical protein